MAKMPVIDPKRCNGCGLCVEVCHCKVIVRVNDVVEINKTKECQLCTKWCTMCELVCPTGAIQCPFDVVTEE